MNMNERIEASGGEVISLAAEIVAAYVSNNTLPASELPDLIKSVQAALSTENAAGDSPKEDLKPAVPVRKSITPDYIVCLEDGKRFKSLKRHLRSRYDLSPDEYRAKWGLPADYPMVAPNYAASRSALAKKMGLGQKRKAAERQGGRGRKKAA